MNWGFFSMNEAAMVKGTRPASPLLLSLILSGATVTFLEACNMGTEVGNGVHPISSPNPSAQPEGGTTEAKNSSAGDPLGDSAMPSSSQGSGSAATPDTSILDAAFGSCASPLAENLRQPLGLSTTNALGLTTRISMSRADDGSWKIFDQANAWIRSVTKKSPAGDGDYAVVLRDASGTTVDPGFVCSPATATQNTPIPGTSLSGTRLAFSLRGSGASYQLIWYKTESQASAELVRVELVGTAGTSTFVASP